MKKILLLTVASIMLFIAVFSLFSANENSSIVLLASDVEALASGESGVNVVCQCAGFLGNSDCKASNSNSVCASGNNIQCQNWNGNC